VSMRIIVKVCSCLLSRGGRHYSALHPPGWLTVGGFAVGGNGGAPPDSEPVSAMRLSMSLVGIADGGVVAGGVVAELVVLGALLRVCLESLRGGLVMGVVFPGAKPCCFIKSWMAALMVAIWASNLFWVSSKLFWVSCIAVWACCMWLSWLRSSTFSDSRLFLDRLLLLFPVGSVFWDCMVMELLGELSPGGVLAKISL